VQLLQVVAQAALEPQTPLLVHQSFMVVEAVAERELVPAQLV
jgi:hypothetical protein